MTATPTPTPTPTVGPQGATVAGQIVDSATGTGISGITVAIAPAATAFTATMSGATPPPSSPNVATATTDANGNFTITVGSALTYNSLNYGTNFYLTAYGGATYSMNSFHGQFAPTNNFGSGTGTGLNASGASNVGTLKLTAPTTEQGGTLTQINQFRAAPGPIGGATYPQYAATGTLVMDENFMEVAAYWSGQMHKTGIAGHSCSQIGNPAGCMDPSVYLSTLPGEGSGANTGGDTCVGCSGWNGSSASTNAAQAFEAEGSYCAPNPYNWRACPSQAPAGQLGQTGHYVFLMQVTQFAGFGEIKTAPTAYTLELQ